ncbi:CPBP family intramembrane metalloprotease [Weeksellaceae bacterium TAE3-ERU29]|nr:CPBP family intramembrane metalloprotease [Weeksellaceae bacterium TAE3-ERU29]
MKRKVIVLGILLLSVIGMAGLFIGIILLANHIKVLGYKQLGNICMISFPLIVYFGVRLFNRKINKLKAKDYGFGFKNFIKNALTGIGLALIINVIVLLTAYLFFGIQINFMGLKEGFEKPLISLLMTMLVVGVWEEFYFRGLIFNTLLKNKFGFHTSALISSLIFSIVHWSSFDMNETSYFWYVGIVFIGYLLVYLYVYTHSIWSVAFFHFMWDILATLINNNENKIGVFEVQNYTKHAITIDNIYVVYLGIILVTILFISRKKVNNTNLFYSK